MERKESRVINTGELAAFWEDHIEECYSKMAALFVLVDDSDHVKSDWCEPVGPAAKKGFAMILEDGVMAFGKLRSVIYGGKPIDEVETEGV